MDLVFECQILVFEWEGFELKSFWKDTSMYVCVYREREREKDAYQPTAESVSQPAVTWCNICHRTG